MPPGVVTGKEQYGLKVKALVITLYDQCQSTVGRIVTFLNDLGMGDKRALSSGSRGPRKARDTGLGAAKTGHKRGVSFWDDLPHRLGVTALRLSSRCT